ncbi:MAG: adenylate/guanylate cyclase domain-containing protein [Alphaproteobacteria bacterium]|nr:adenylate/guanylate cyclase domain-containing protein [Alphaproteobacteria bacterium]
MTVAKGNEHTSEALPSEQPFPLKRLFRRRFIPAFLGFIGIFLILIGYTARYVSESIYLEQAQRRAQTIARAVAKHAPDAWKQLMEGRAFADLQSSKNILAVAFTNEVQEQNLRELKVYNLDRRVLFATRTKEIGTQENGAPLREVINEGALKAVTKTLADGTKQYELYVPVFDSDGRLRAVFELYEPVGHLNAVMIGAALPAVAIPAGMLLLLMFALSGLVNRAQADINMRTDALNVLRKRIETFVSVTAVHAAREAAATGSIQSRKVITTLLFSDIRSFTSFAEENPPEAVVGFLNQLMTLQVDAVTQHGGDVDKMIGDAVLARFDGEDGGKRGLDAAREIIDAVNRGNYPRHVGIGVFRGEVISGAIGPESRRDFTVIGDAVNISARLCSEALAGEIVVDAVLADDDFGPVETIQVKGRQEPITVRRFKV